MVVIFLLVLSNLSLHFRETNKSVYVIGDFNINLLHAESSHYAQESTVSSLVESPTQLSNAVNDIQRLPSETVRSVSSLVESSTSNTEDEIQGSLIELGKKLKESKVKRRKFKDKLNRKKMKDYRYMFWGTRAIDLINN